MSQTMHQLAKRVAFAEDGTRLITGYVPRVSLAVVAIVCFGIIAIVSWTQFFLIKRQRYMLTLTIGSTCMVLGYILRIPFRSSPDSVGLYAITTLFVLLSPCAFLALEYMLLGRLALYLGPETVAKRCLVFRASRIAKFFVTTDVVTFLIQAAGGGMSAIDNPSTANAGHKIALVGVVVQAVAFCTFTCFLIYFGYRVKNLYPEKWHGGARQPSGSVIKIFSKQPIADWRILYYGMLVACIGFIVRSIFRAVEFSQGYDGYLVTTESYFYALDALPILFSVAIFAVLFPPRFLMSQHLFLDNGVEMERTRDESSEKIVTNRV